MTLFCEGVGGCRLSLIQMVMLTHLKAEFGKRGNCRCDCDGYRPDTLEMIYHHISTRQLRIDELSRLTSPQYRYLTLKFLNLLLHRLLLKVIQNRVGR